MSRVASVWLSDLCRHLGLQDKLPAFGSLEESRAREGRWYSWSDVLSTTASSKDDVSGGVIALSLAARCCFVSQTATGDALSLLRPAVLRRAALLADPRQARAACGV